jgi:ATP-dependent Clp protease adapter protein ClpS
MKLLQELETIIRPPKMTASPKEVELNKPGGFNVMILNNPVTPFQVVQEALMSSVGLSSAKAQERMMRAHKGGWACVATYASNDVAETVANKITQHAAANDRYDHIKQYQKFTGPWPLDTEVMEADGS